MRWLLILVVVLLAVWYFMPDPEPVPLEETFIAEPVSKLQEAEAYEDEYLEQAEAHKRRMEEALDGDGG